MPHAGLHKRVFRREWRSRVAFFRSEQGGGLTLGEAIEHAAHQIDEQQAAEILEDLLTHSVETINFSELHKLRTNSPEDAEFVWQQMKEEARREFMAGHLAATVFEPVEWMRSAFATLSSTSTNRRAASGWRWWTRWLILPAVPAHRAAVG